MSSSRGRGDRHARGCLLSNVHECTQVTDQFCSGNTSKLERLSVPRLDWPEICDFPVGTNTVVGTMDCDPGTVGMGDSRESWLRNGDLIYYRDNSAKKIKSLENGVYCLYAGDFADANRLYLLWQKECENNLGSGAWDVKKLAEIGYSLRVKEDLDCSFIVVGPENSSKKVKTYTVTRSGHKLVDDSWYLGGSGSLAINPWDYWPDSSESREYAEEELAKMVNQAIHKVDTCGGKRLYLFCGLEDSEGPSWLEDDKLRTDVQGSPKIQRGTRVPDDYDVDPKTLELFSLAERKQC